MLAKIFQVGSSNQQLPTQNRLVSDQSSQFNLSSFMFRFASETPAPEDLLMFFSIAAALSPVSWTISKLSSANPPLIANLAP